MEERKYRDIDGNEISLISLVRKEPQWAANVITNLRDRCDRLQTELSLIRQTTLPPLDVIDDRNPEEAKQGEREE